MPTSAPRPRPSTPPSARWKPSCCTSSHTSRRLRNPIASTPVERRVTSTATTAASSTSGVSTRARSCARSMTGTSAETARYTPRNQSGWPMRNPGGRDELGGQAREGEGGESTRDDHHERDRRADEPFEAGADVVGGGRAAGAHRSPVVEAREAAGDEEQRHDLHDPADRPEPGLLLERVLEHRPAGADADAAHHRVQREHRDEQHDADRVDARIAHDARAPSSGCRGIRAGTCERVGHGPAPSGAAHPPTIRHVMDAVPPARITRRCRCAPYPGTASRRPGEGRRYYAPGWTRPVS